MLVHQCLCVTASGFSVHAAADRHAQLAQRCSVCGCVFVRAQCQGSLLSNTNCQYAMKGMVFALLSTHFWHSHCQLNLISLLANNHRAP